MLRILLCMTCCSAPKSSRPARRKANVLEDDAKLVEEANFNKLIPTNGVEKSQLLTNQIQANLNSYGSKDGDIQGKILMTESSKVANAAESDKQVVLEKGLIIASTSAPAQFSSQIKRDRSNEEEMADYTGVRDLNFDDDRSATPPSSIDIEPFKENPGDQTLLASPPQRTYLNDDSGANASAYEQTTSTGSQQVNQQVSDQLVESAPETGQARLAKNIQSTTKIGDYARIEYSPVEDLESLTAMSYDYSRGGSEKGGMRPSSVSGSDKGLSRKSSPSRSVATNEALSRRSSQGIESTSISIASQLSNEQFQQNLTNMLETAISPSQLFGTIGLPLGPPLENSISETAKTSPETTGAALTSASQDSYSDASLGSPPASRATTIGTMTLGAALVNDSIEDSVEIVPTQAHAINKQATGTVEKLITSATATERLESPTSMVTTTSGGLTNPTPTPSEMSATSSTKKRRKFKAKAFLKKLRPGSKKRPKDESFDSK